MDYKIDNLNFSEEKLRALKEILEDSHYQPQIDVWHPGLIKIPLLQVGAYKITLSANNAFTDQFEQDLPGHPNVFQVDFQRIMNPWTGELDHFDVAHIPLRQIDLEGVDTLADFYKITCTKIINRALPHLQKQELLSKTLFDETAAKIIQKKERLEKEYPDYKIVLPENQSMFDTWDENLSLLVLPPGFYDDTMNQLGEYLSSGENIWDAKKAYTKFLESQPLFKSYPRIEHPNFDGTGRVINLYEQQLSESDSVSMRFFIDPNIPSIDYLTDSNDHPDLKKLLLDVRPVVKEEAERIERFRALRNGRFFKSETYQTEAEKSFLYTLYKELQPHCKTDDLENIENAVIHATKQAFLNDGIQRDVEDFICKYAPVPPNSSPRDFTTHIMRCALKDPKVQEITHSTELGYEWEP